MNLEQRWWSEMGQPWWSIVPTRIPGKIIRNLGGKRAAIRPLIRLPGENSSPRHEFQGETTRSDPGSFVTFEWEFEPDKAVVCSQAKNIVHTDRSTAESLEAEIRTQLSYRWASKLHELQNRLDAEKEQLDDRVERLLGERLQLREHALDSREQELEERERQLERREEDIAKRNRELAERERILEPYRHLIAPLVHSKSPPRNHSEARVSASDWREYLQDAHYIAPGSVATQFILCLLTSAYAGSLVLLSGPVGVGKTSIVTHASRFLGGEMSSIPVRPGWLDPSDLLGFYDPIHRMFQPGPLSEAVATAAESEDRLHIVCLDELNLGRVENYASDILSRLEYSKGPHRNVDDANSALSLYPSYVQAQLMEEACLLSSTDETNSRDAQRLTELKGILSRYPAQLTITPNLVIVGTLNADETTYQLSAKVIDRSYVVECPPARGLEDLLRGFEELAAVPAEGYMNPETLRNEVTRRLVTPRDRWKELAAWNDEYLRHLGTPLGYRSREDYKVFVAAADWLGIDEEQAHQLFVHSKVLPRIGFRKDESEQRTELLERWLKQLLKAAPEGLEISLYRLKEQLEDRQNPVVRYWD